MITLLRLITAGALWAFAHVSRTGRPTPPSQVCYGDIWLARQAAHDAEWQRENGGTS